MENEFDYGRAYAEEMQGEDGFDSPVDIEEMVHSSCAIPDDDYYAMKTAGIINPDPREYWRGFNSYFE